MPRFYAETNGVRLRLRQYQDTVEGTLSVPARLANRLSAIHIHKGVHGRPGPILVWLATSERWQHGVLQLTPGTNAPCCSNALCNIVAPKDTPHVRHLAGKETTFHYKIKINRCARADCRALEDFGSNFLVIHGNNYQTIYNGCLSAGIPNLDVVGNSQLRAD